MEKLEFSSRLLSVQADIKSRLRKRDLREYTYIDPIPLNGANPFADVFEQMPDAPYVIALAHSIVHSWLCMPPVIYRDEVLVGITRPTYPLMEHFSWGIQFHLEKVNEENGYCETEKDRIEGLRSRMTPLDYEHMHAAGRELLGAEHYEMLTKEKMYWAGGYQGHTLPNYVTLLENGLDGMLPKMTGMKKPGISMRPTGSSSGVCLPIWSSMPITQSSRQKRILRMLSAF